MLTQDLDHLLRYAKCMRSHSVINFPDPVLRSGLPPGFDFPPNMDLTSPAFLAADTAQPVHMSHLLTAARAEYGKLERPLAEAEIREWQ